MVRFEGTCGNSFRRLAVESGIATLFNAKKTWTDLLLPLGPKRTRISLQRKRNRPVQPMPHINSKKHIGPCSKDRHKVPVLPVALVP